MHFVPMNNSLHEDEMWSRAYDLASSGKYRDANNILKEIGLEYPGIWQSLGSDPDRFFHLREFAFKTYHKKNQHTLS